MGLRPVIFTELVVTLGTAGQVPFWTEANTPISFCVKFFLCHQRRTAQALARTLTLSWGGMDEGWHVFLCMSKEEVWPCWERSQVFQGKPDDVADSTDTGPAADRTGPGNQPWDLWVGFHDHFPEFLFFSMEL